MKLMKLAIYARVEVPTCLLTVGLAVACWSAIRARSAKRRSLLLRNFRVEEVLKDEVWQRHTGFRLCRGAETGWPGDGLPALFLIALSSFSAVTIVAKRQRAHIHMHA